MQPAEDWHRLTLLLWVVGHELRIVIPVFIFLKQAQRLSLAHSLSPQADVLLGLHGVLGQLDNLPVGAIVKMVLPLRLEKL